MLIGILSGDAALDINIHDTYYVIAHFHLAILISILFGIIGIGYWIMQKADRKLSKWLNWIHIGLTFGGIILILILSQLYREPKTDTILSDFDFNQKLDIIIFIILLITIFGQVIYPINLISGIIKKRKKTSG
ncbi:cbb3-type cytochrome c oxidase subunit I [Formosa haliotis]|uniref:cbb3-type cytochrome c oxidase subunit I n=1 Tax=Formosa haliotis TaxID=1555194 RepID=UPI00082702F4|nr:cbb3-type cytochrome c oxidase subunit I [Formosa haliotis]